MSSRITTILSVLGLSLSCALAAGCGGGQRAPQIAAGGNARASSLRHSALAFASCMRSHGVPDYPDPQISSSGNQVGIRISPGTTDPNSPASMAAGHMCHHLLPFGGDVGTGAAGAQQIAQGTKFAVCMRAHGVPAFPDPGRDGGFDLPQAANPQAPQFMRAMHLCASDEPQSVLFGRARGA